MKKKVQIREIGPEQLRADLLKDFDRTQHVEKVWRNVDGERRIVPCTFTEYWDDELKREIVFGDFAEAMEFGGRVFMAYEGKKLLGFAVLGGQVLGDGDEYLQLIQLQVSHLERGNGVGRMLFACCAQMAKVMGAKKLYISAHSSVESQAFYQKMGCVDAQWIFAQQVELEPFDVQMEFIVG
mgnify:CR=1 FL=1